MKLKKLKDLAKDKKKVEVDLNKFKFQKEEDIATRMAKLKGKFIPQEDIERYGTPEEKEFLKEMDLLEDRYSEFDPKKKQKLQVRKLHLKKIGKLKSKQK